MFPYPDERGEAFDWILDMAPKGDVYGCPNLLTGRKRDEFTAVTRQLAHGDVDHSFNHREVEDELGGIVVASGSDGHGQILIPLSAAVTEEQRMALCVAIRARYDGDDKIADNDVLRPPVHQELESEGTRRRRTNRGLSDDRPDASGQDQTVRPRPQAQHRAVEHLPQR